MSGTKRRKERRPISLEKIHSRLLYLEKELSGIAFMIMTHDPDVELVDVSKNLYEGFGRVLMKKAQVVRKSANEIDLYSMQARKINRQ